MLSVRESDCGSVGRSGMRTFFAPARIAKVFGGYMCFESESDYREK